LPFLFVNWRTPKLTPKLTFSPFCVAKTYTNATIESVTPATATIFWDGGGERISMTNLPSELQTLYHYDPQEAQKYLDMQAAKKTEKQEQANRANANFLAAQNTLGPPQKIRIVKPLLFPNSLQIEAEGKTSKACIPNLPPKVLTFIRDLDQAQADANAPKGQSQPSQQAKYKAGHPKPNSTQNGARNPEQSAADPAVYLRDLQAKAEASTTIIARPTGIMISYDIRQWQFQAMATTNAPDKHQH
jgi:hypothetical protein